MYGFALGLFFITVAAALAMILIVSYHFWMYRIQGDRAVQILAVFLIGSAILAVAFSVSFLAVPWADLPDIARNYR